MRLLSGAKGFRYLTRQVLIDIVHKKGAHRASEPERNAGAKEQKKQGEDTGKPYG
ncbi:hypothetical protein EMQ_2895 [Acetobacter aceti NBRC 14818]|uniref:Uncharacterized protein n=2 Tax=Acetobacter aceti TaxID=435 RepID=A0A6S6PI80_ACEAC|nr:hypothetical protein AAJCM20276_09450 [Acetobacter aceti]BCK77289.1 hypothetical protein EMQ_2895 [Acetobacter aceti NBRC 14818]GAN58386.1 hypothetical protein Abac_048_020 [Acetobacter aceti NBRC 14818]